ncbi:hypothetical protein [Nonomuraea jabiensis]|uniref:hypothetical protein n=1 Tax=Nonomuraea jabiensis TaxID=882448 RepID=UPI0036C9DF6C
MEEGQLVVDVMTAADDDPMFPLGRPVGFTLVRRGRRPRTYQVERVLEAWVTTRQWWRENLPYDAPLDIWHFRLQARSEQGAAVLMLSADVARQCWSLDKFEGGR